MPKKKFDRKKMKKELLKRTHESFVTRDDMGMFRSFFDQEKISELNVEFWSCGEGSHRVDIVPFMAGAHHPRVEEGHPAYNLDIWVHRGVGATEDAYVCPLKNYGNPCPICEDYAEKKNDPEIDDAVVDAMRAKRRVVYNVVVKDSKREQNEGVRLWEVSHWFVERHIATISRDDETGQTIAPADPDEGKTLAFTKEGSGARSTSFIGHRFVDRPEPLSDEILEQAYPIDELIHIPAYEELKKAHFGEVDEEDSEEEDWEEEEIEDENDEDEVLEEDEDEEDDEGESSSTERNNLTKNLSNMNRTQLKKFILENEISVKVKKKMSDDDIRDSIIQEMFDSPSGSCPFGHEFGVDTDDTPDCDNCDQWSACAEAAEATGE